MAPVLSETANLAEPTSSSDQIIIPKKLPEEGLELYLEKIEKEILLNALNLTHWNRTLAAKKLGMSFRSLRYRLKNSDWIPKKRNNYFCRSSKSVT